MHFGEAIHYDPPPTVFEYTPDTCPKHKWHTITPPMISAFPFVECTRCGKTGWWT